MLNRYFSKITLFTVLAFLSFVGLVITAASRQATETKSWLLIRLSASLILLVGIDVLLKLILRLPTLWLWIIQVLLVLIAVYIWIVSE